MNKFIAALQQLSNLANQCIEIECTVLSTLEQASKLDFTQDVTGYQFSYYLRCITNHSKLEQINAKVIFKSLDQHYTDHIDGSGGGKLNISQLGSGLIEEMHSKTELLSQLGSLNIIRDIVLDVTEQPAELEYINEVLSDFIEAVRSVTTCLWSLKVLFQSNKIQNFSMNFV